MVEIEGADVNKLTELTCFPNPNPLIPVLRGQFPTQVRLNLLPRNLREGTKFASEHSLTSRDFTASEVGIYIDLSLVPYNSNILHREIQAIMKSCGSRSDRLLTFRFVRRPYVHPPDTSTGIGDRRRLIGILSMTRTHTPLVHHPLP